MVFQRWCFHDSDTGDYDAGAVHASRVSDNGESNDYTSLMECIA